MYDTASHDDSHKRLSSFVVTFLLSALTVFPLLCISGVLAFPGSFAHITAAFFEPHVYMCVTVNVCACVCVRVVCVCV